jgi:predicted anti-sigma-YlaC factor YlaD
MKCEEVRTRIDDYVDGELRPPARDEVAEHLRGCADCRAEEQGVRSLLAAAATLPRELEPARELWPGIAERLPRLLPFPRPAARLQPLALLAAAALLIALSSLVTWRVARTPETREAAGRPAAPQGTLIAHAPAAGLLDAEAEYARATGELLMALEARRDALAPETLVAVEQNLRAIDDALKSLREALSADPGNQELTQLLTSTHKRKLEALRRVVRLSRI